ncbi:endonuclease/exonuclease/phosphatase family protein [Arthrobacter sp. 35W]|uniref:endonuclease/exonuclease/phosphatase family protein n=1 Tax=Arthrobacter sp. 35W TaxID=1132441 RepID=UPI0003F54B31|nr:endonuclease/exonuclease/phosphatase family protein [Arthrobacter sp. 35W]
MRFSSAPAPARRRRALGWTTAAAALLLALAMAGYKFLPPHSDASFLLGTALPWLGLAVPVLAVASLRARSWLGGAGTAAALAAWLVVAGPWLLPSPAPAAPSQAAGQSSGPLRVASQNLRAGNLQAPALLDNLAQSGADVVALQEVTGSTDTGPGTSIGAAYPHQSRVGTVALLSKTPISNVQPLALGLGWKRALNATVSVGGSEVSVYVVHAASARPNDHADRDTMLESLAGIVATDTSSRVVALGDFNAASDENILGPIKAQLSEPSQAERGPGFTWPSAFPMARPDHIFARGLTGISSTVVDSIGSDHKGVTADFAL